MPFQDTFSEANYRLFIGLVLDVLLKPWEKTVMSLKYTEVNFSLISEGFKLIILPLQKLGAVRFDRDLRSIIAYLASQTTFGDIREKFLRLQQISTLLNLDAVRSFPITSFPLLNDICRMKTLMNFTMDLVYRGR